MNRSKILNTFLLTLTIALTAVVNRAGAQASVLSAGDILFTAFDASPAKDATTAPFDRVSFVALKDINATTEIYFTDRGYFGSGWQAEGSTEGTIKWTVGAKVTAGTEVTVITEYLQLKALVGGIVNGNVTSLSSSTVMSLASLDQVIAFQGGAGNPAASGVRFLAGIHWNSCANGNYNAFTDDAGWDNVGTAGSCAAGVSRSNMPPTLVGGSSAFWIGAYFPTPPAIDNTTYYKGQFNGAGKPYASMDAIRAAVMNKSNWIKVKNGSSDAVNVPTGHFASTLPVDLINLSASINKQGLLSVSWQTSSENNNSHFIVQASVNGSTWTDVAKVNSKVVGGNSSQQLSYSVVTDLGGYALAGIGLLGLLLIPSCRNKYLRLLVGALLLSTVWSCAKTNSDEITSKKIASGTSIYVRLVQVDLDGVQTIGQPIVPK